jgi:hypothetical protein
MRSNGIKDNQHHSVVLGVNITVTVFGNLDQFPAKTWPVILKINVNYEWFLHKIRTQSRILLNLQLQRHSRQGYFFKVIYICNILLLKTHKATRVIVKFYNAGIVTRGRRIL